MEGRQDAEAQSRDVHHQERTANNNSEDTIAQISWKHRWLAKNARNDTAFLEQEFKTAPQSGDVHSSSRLTQTDRQKQRPATLPAIEAEKTQE